MAQYQYHPPSRRGPDVQAHEHAVGVREVADDPPNWLRQAPHEGRHREDLIARGELRVLDQVDDLDPVLAGHVLLAELLEVGERLDRLGRLPGDVEPQDLDLMTRLAGRRGHTRTNVRHFHTSPFLASPYVRFTLIPSACARYRCSPRPRRGSPPCHRGRRASVSRETGARRSRWPGRPAPPRTSPAGRPAPPRTPHAAARGSAPCGSAPAPSRGRPRAPPPLESGARTR